MARAQLQTLTEPMYYVLLALLAGPTHGYEIMKTVNRISKRSVKIGAGTLYALLKRFDEEEIIRYAGGGQRRKVYNLEPKGRKMLSAEHARLKAAVVAYEECLMWERERL